MTDEEHGKRISESALDLARYIAEAVEAGLRVEVLVGARPGKGAEAEPWADISVERRVSIELRKVGRPVTTFLGGRMMV